MGRPEPCVLYAQSFTHPNLDEYVDEVRFTEPVVISACEFLEHNASASCPMITLSGASCPPSFALEVFVHCEGEPRFRRLCQPFLYSPSSSNILEVQAVVTNHLLIRGSYRTLTLVVYGNTAEDLGQFSVEFDLDNSLASLVRSPAEGKIEDLPLALQPIKPTFLESISTMRWLHLLAVDSQQSHEVKQLLYMTIKIAETPLDESSAQKMVKALLSATSSFLSIDFSVLGVAGNQRHNGIISSHINNRPSILTNLVKAKSELMELYKIFVLRIDNLQSGKLEQEFELEDKVEPFTEGPVLNILQQWFHPDKQSVSCGLPVLTQVENLIGGLSIVHLLCTDTEGCYQFVRAGGMQYLIDILRHDLGRSTATTLMTLGVIECACRHALGCEAYLGWWPHKDVHDRTGISEGYCTLLRLLLQRQRHDVACLGTHILHRLRAYEIVDKFESTVRSLLESPSADDKIPELGIKALVGANLELKRLLKLLNLRDPIEDSSPVARAKRSLIGDQDDVVLSYKATYNLIVSSKYCIAQRDIDPHLLSVLKERCFLPLLAALLSVPSLRAGTGATMDIFVDLVTTIEAILLSLLFCRSGLLFLLSEPEAAASLVLALQGPEDLNREEFLSLRYAAVLVSKGFFCPPQDIGMIVETNLRVVSAIDRMIGAAHHSEELLWALWDLCSVSRSDIGRQAVLAVGHFPEAISVLMAVLQSGKESEPVNSNNGACPLSLAIFHAAAELFEVMVTDSTASTLVAWIPHVVELHKALHSSSPGSNKKDAPSRLLEWVDAAVVYHKKGAIGLLRYAAVLASGGDAQITSTSLLLSDPMDVDNVVADSAGGPDFQVVESLLGKLVSDKFFEGIILRDSSIPQLTTAMRILAFLADHPGVAAGLYEEGAVTVLYVIIMNSAFMLERSSNTYDYLVDEGAECNSTADLLLERSREQYLLEMLLPSLVLLITLLRKLQETGERHRNTKLLNGLLRLHREISPKLAARTAVRPFSYPCSTLALGAVCHLLVSAVACWPIFGWTPGLFQCLLENVPAPASLALGPKEACSVFCLLGELFPEEGVWLWKNGTSSLNALRTLGVGTLLGVKSIEDIDWYLQPPHFEKLINRLMPHLDKIAQIVLHFACAALVVLQDMLRVLIIRMACQKSDHAAVLLRPLLAWIKDHICEGVPISEIDVFKGERLLEFLAGLLEHPLTKVVLMKEGLVDILTRALDKKNESLTVDEKSTMEGKLSSKEVSSLLVRWYTPIFRSFSLMCNPGVSVHPTAEISRRLADCPPFEGWRSIVLRLLKFCQVAPVGKELQACWDAITALASHNFGRAAFAFVALQMQSPSFPSCQDMPKEHEKVFAVARSDELDDQMTSPLLECWQNLLTVLESDKGFTHGAVEIVKCFALAALCLCEAGKSAHGVLALRSLFGLCCGSVSAEQHNGEKLRQVSRMIDLLNSKVNEADSDIPLHTRTILDQARSCVGAMLRLLQKPIGTIQLAEIELKTELTSSTTEIPVSSWELPPHLCIASEFLTKININEPTASPENIEEPDRIAGESYFLGGLADKFMWECPDSSPDRPSMPILPLKRKQASAEGSNRRQRGDGVGSGGGAETTATNTFVRTGPSTVSSSGPTRRDTFRQRKPNTSRPPSMHVDDYVARERNNDGMSSSSNVANSVQRAGSTGGRPPSIHVDEFMARQRERQQPVTSIGGDLQPPVQTLLSEAENNVDKNIKSRQMKAPLEDDLQEINIELDVVSETDDVLQFSQTDDFLQSAPVILQEEKSPDSLVDDTEFNTSNATQFVPTTKESTETAVDGIDSMNLESRKPLTQSEGEIPRHGSLTLDKGQGKHSPNRETPFHQEQFDNRTPNTLPITMKGYEAINISMPLVLPQQFYDQGSGVIQSVGEPRPVPLLASHHRTSQAGSGPMLTVSQPHFEQKGPAHVPPLPPLPPPPTIPPGLSPQMIEASPGHASSYIHTPPLPSGLPFQAFDSSGGSVGSSVPGRDQRPTAPKDYYTEGMGSNISTALAPPLPPVNSRAPLEVPLRPPPPLQFHAEHPRPVSYGSVAPVIPRPLVDTISGVNTSTTPWVGVSSASRVSDDATATSGSGRPPPPLPPTPPPFSAAPVLQPALQTSNVQSLSSMYVQTSTASLPPPPTSSSDKRFGNFSTSGMGQSSAAQSHPQPPPFVPPLPPGRPTTLAGSLPGAVPTQQQGQSQHSHTHHIQQHIPSQLPQPPPQPRQPPQPPQPPQPRPPQPPRPPLQLQPQMEQRHQIHTQASVHQTPVQFQPQPPQLQQHPHPSQNPQQHPHLHQQQTQQHYYQHQQQDQHQQHHLQHGEHAQPQHHLQQGEHAQAQHHPQQGEHVQQQHLQQHETVLTLQQYFSSPEAIQELLNDQEKLRKLLEEHPKLMQMLQERLNQL